MDNCGTCTRKLLIHAEKFCMLYMQSEIPYEMYHSVIRIYTDSILHDANVWSCVQCLSSIFPFNALENDVDFISAIADFNLSSGQTMCYLAEKLFIPFELNDKDQASIWGESDPDLHYYSSSNQLISKCNCFLESSFNENYERCKSSEMFSQCVIWILEAWAKILKNLIPIWIIWNTNSRLLVWPKLGWKSPIVICIV